MKVLDTACLFVLFAPLCFAQDAPPLTNQSSYPSGTHKTTRKEKRQTRTAQGQSVDLNTASKQDIAALPGIGPHYAQTIIDARPFTSKEDLLRKKVIPEGTYGKIQDRVTANGPKKNSVPDAQEH
ncbi:MAG: helix-hairpin-helix domain-containing protein [Acidobacteriota bacterium]|nr:helix-hairpin-helix domain-containing protein [Acidobacteriota bacterium]